MHSSTFLLMLSALAGCAPTPNQDPVPGETALLTGTWNLVVHREGQEDLLGVVTLAPSEADDQTVPEILRGGTLEGHFRLAGQGWLPSAPSDSGTSAFIAADSAVVLYLRLEGRCANCGNLGFAGRLTGDQVSGHWVQEMSSTPPQGSFTLSRSGTGPDPT